MWSLDHTHEGISNMSDQMRRSTMLMGGFDVDIESAPRFFRLLTSMLVVVALTVSAAIAAAAEPAYPTKPVRILVGFSPGGGTDVVARVVTRKLGETWGQTFVIDNRTGAGGLVAAEVTANATPDGHTLLMTSSSLTIQPSVIEKLPFDTVRDFAAIRLIASTPYLLVAHPGLEAKSVKELIELAKKQPGKINIATSGAGSSVHLTALLFNTMAGTDMVLVPYKGVASMVDLIAGQVHLTFQSLPVLESHVRAGRLRPLAVTSTVRSPVYPDIPTISEAGVRGFDVITWYGLIGPARLPKVVIDKLNSGISSVLKSPDVRQPFAGMGLTIVDGTPAEFAARIGEEIEKWKRVIKPTWSSSR